MSAEARPIERVEASGFLRRLADLRATSSPIIITDLFRGSALATLTSAAAVRDLLGDEHVTYGERYVDLLLDKVRRHTAGLSTPSGMHNQRGTIAEFLDLAAEQADHIISEQPTPDKLLADLNLSALGVRAVRSGIADPLADTALDVAYSTMFMADAGGAADMHADGDGRDVLLYQCYGRRYVCLVPVSAGALLHPVGPYATVRIAAMSTAERASFLAYAGGYETVLEPGETVFMPAFIWHHLNYLEASFSVNFRFGGIEDPLARELIRRVPFTQHVQRIIVGTRDPARAELGREAAREVLLTARARFPSARAKYRAVYESAARHAPVGTDRAGHRYLGPFFGTEELLDGALSGYYNRSPQGPGGYDRLWHLRERARDVVRRRARRVAYRA